MYRAKWRLFQFELILLLRFDLILTILKLKPLQMRLNNMYKNKSQQYSKA